MQGNDIHWLPSKLVATLMVTSGYHYVPRHAALSRGNMPTQALANGVKLLQVSVQGLP